MEIKKGCEHYIDYYKEQGKDSEKAQQAFNLAQSYANKVEELVKLNKNLKLEDAFEHACINLCEAEQACGYIKSAAFTILEKTWVHGDAFMEYSVEKERVKGDELDK